MEKPTIDYEGKTYTVKRAFKRNGELFFVCDTSELFGPENNHVMAKLVKAVRFPSGTTLVPGEDL